MEEEGARADKRFLTIAWLGLFVGVLAVARAWHDGEAVPARQAAEAFELDLPRARQLGGTGDQWLNVALVGYTTGATAVLDAVQMRVPDTGAFEFDIGFRTPDEAGAPFGFGRLGSSSIGRDRWQERIESSRALPDVFGQLKVHLHVEGRSLGVRDGWQGLQLTTATGHGYRASIGSAGGGTWNPPTDDLLLRERQPVARMFLEHGYALLWMRCDTDHARSFDAGSREAWRTEFREALDEWQVADIGSQPFEVGDDYESFSPRWHGTAAELLSFGFVLRDADAVAAAADHLRFADGFELALASTRRTPTSLHAFYDEHVDAPLRRLWRYLVTGDLEEPRDVLWREHWVELLAVSQDGKAAERLVDALVRSGLTPYGRRFVLEHESWGVHEPVQRQYERLRDTQIRGLRMPWSVLLRSDWLLAGWLLLIPVLAFVVAFWVRPVEGRVHRPFELARGGALLLGLLGFVTPCGVVLRLLLLPFWWWLAVRWLRTPLRHGLAERVIVALALAMESVLVLQHVGWYARSATFEAMASPGQLLCWCLLGLVLDHDGRWRGMRRYRWFLVGLLAMSCYAGLGGDAAWIAIGLLIFTLGAYLSFALAGRETPSGLGAVGRPVGA